MKRENLAVGAGWLPIRMVWFGLATAVGITTESKVFPGDRAAVRAAAVEHALQFLASAAG